MSKSAEDEPTKHQTPDILLVLMPVVLVLAISAIVWWLVSQAESSRLTAYSAAVELMEKKQWQEAMVKWQELGSYKDSVRQKEIASYHFEMQQGQKWPPSTQEAADAVAHLQRACRIAEANDLGLDAQEAKSLLQQAEVVLRERQERDAQASRKAEEERKAADLRDERDRREGKRFGLTEKQRRALIYQMVVEEDEAYATARREYPMSMVVEKAERAHSLTAASRKRLMRKYRITEDQLGEIKKEAIENNWPLPPVSGA